MAANPNPDRITDELWAFWEAFQALEPSVRYGGTYVRKPGYHGTRDENAKSWPGNYSIRDEQDQRGPADKTAAIDLTFPDAQAGRYDTIDLYSSRLLASGQDADDPRGDYLREFYGQADADTAVEGWDFRYLHTATSDSSHLWHIHISISREYVANAECFAALLSILKGETVAQWRAGGTQEDDMYLLFEKGTGLWWLVGGGRDPQTGMPYATQVHPSQLADYRSAGIFREGNPVPSVSPQWYAKRTPPLPTGTADVDEKALAAELALLLPKPLTFDETVAAANEAEDS